VKYLIKHALSRATTTGRERNSSHKDRASSSVLQVKRQERAGGRHTPNGPAGGQGGSPAGAGGCASDRRTYEVFSRSAVPGGVADLQGTCNGSPMATPMLWFKGTRQNVMAGPPAIPSPTGPLYNIDFANGGNTRHDSLPPTAYLKTDPQRQEGRKVAGPTAGIATRRCLPNTATCGDGARRMAEQLGEGRQGARAGTFSPPPQTFAGTSTRSGRPTELARHQLHFRVVYNSVAKPRR